MQHDQDHNQYLEWLYLEADGGLAGPDRARLQHHLLSCAECRREREQLPALFDLLASDRVEVREGFADQVMSSLPPAGWEARYPRAWISAAAVLAVLIGFSALLVGTSGGQLEGVGAVLAIVELFRSTITAGSGLLAASWQGLGMAVGEIAGGSPLQTAVFALFVLGVNVLFARLLLRSWRRPLPDRAGRASKRSD